MTNTASLYSRTFSQHVYLYLYLYLYLEGALQMECRPLFVQFGCVDRCLLTRLHGA